MTLSAACEVCQAIGKLRLEHLGHAELFPSSPTNAADMDLVVQVLCRNSVCYQVNHLTRNNCLKGDLAEEMRRTSITRKRLQRREQL